MKEIKAQELNENPFKLIGDDWMLITAEKNVFPGIISSRFCR